MHKNLLQKRTIKKECDDQVIKQIFYFVVVDISIILQMWNLFTG